MDAGNAAGRRLAAAIGRELLDCDVHVAIAREPKWPYAATYGNGRLVFNLSRCGRGFFDNGISDDVNALLIHEFGHHYASDHLSEDYYRALCKVGARMVRLALTNRKCSGKWYVSARIFTFCLTFINIVV